MNVDIHLATLREQLAAAAAMGGAETVELAERLAAPLEAAARLVIQDALSDAMQEVTLELAPGSVDVRVRGRDISFAVTRPPVLPVASGDVTVTPPMAPSVEAVEDDGAETGTARISFRPSDRLKGQIEAAAEREGLSVNAFLVRTLTAALRQPGAGGTGLPSAPSAPTAPGARATSGYGNRLEGWVY